MSDTVEGAKETTEGVTEGATFLDSLGEAAKDNALFTGMENAGQLATKAAELNTSLDELRAAQPKVPETAEGYTFEAPEGVELDPDGVKAFQEVAHKIKLDPEQAKELMTYDLQRQAVQVASEEAAAEKAIALMKEEFGANDIALVRIEQLHPWPEKQIQKIIAKYPNTRRWIWIQEEPENMGAWRYVKEKFTDVNIQVVARLASGSPAVGLNKLHVLGQNEIIGKIFRKCTCELKNKYCGLQYETGSAREEIRKQHTYL